MKKNLVKKAVLPALAALLCSVIALTSVSYAWFSIGNSANVESMNMEVTTAGGLQISATGNSDSFKSTLLLADLKGVATNHFPTVTGEKLEAFKPVSTDGTVTDGKLAFFTAENVNGQTGNISASGAEGQYIVFDFYVKVTTATTLRLDQNSVVATTNGKQTHLSSRVGFFNLGYAATAAEAQKIDNGTTPADGTAKIWEPHKTTRSTAYKNQYGESNNGKEMPYKGLIAESETVESSANVATFDLGSSPEELFALGVGYNKIRVFVWVEGQDVDCLNDASGGQFSITLNFSIPEQA